VGTLEPLAWDSEFFGFGIGRLHPDAEGEGAANLTQVEDEARQLGIECLYATLDPIHTDLSVALQRQGFRLVEVAMDFVHRTSVMAVSPPADVVAREGTAADVPFLEEAIALVAPWSRFAVDPRFGLDAAQRMLRAWVERAATAEHRRLLVVEDDDGITAFSTQSTPPGEYGRIDMVASKRAGSGDADVLMDHHLRQVGRGPSRAGPVAARNLPSLRYCERAGFRLETASYLFHRWLDEPAPA
jgi:dTDP-4-amino-4,6-dideoxy-D-galactose acyltransferase